MMTTFGLVGFVLMVMYNIRHRQDPHITQRPAVLTRVVNRTQESSLGPSHRKFLPRCRQDPSATGIAGFSSLPASLQDFLLYRHCRHFPLILDVPDKCGGAESSAQVFFLLVIKSSPSNYARREVLRKTWARERRHNGAWIRRLFISGTTGSGFKRLRMNQLLEQEQREHADILQWDFDDTFYNLTLKQVLFLEWMERNCPAVRFLLNGDDDVFANTGNMVNYLQGLRDNDGGRHLFTGYTFENTGPVRRVESKYFIPTQLQESELYPLYCGGGGIIMSGHTASVIYWTSMNVSLFPIDDVYLGMCLELAGLAPTSHMGVKTLGLEIPSQTVDRYDTCLFRELLLVHRFLPADIFIMWHRVNDPNVECFKNLQAGEISSGNVSIG